MKDRLKFNEQDNDPADDVPNVHFSTNGEGRWWKTEYVRQCTEGVFLQGRCQGVEGHKGVHWRYDASGSFHYDDNESDSSEEGCSGVIPPDHKSYRTPLEMSENYFMSHRTHDEVTDLAEIERLENNETQEGVSITRPVDMSNIPSKLVEELKKRRDEIEIKSKPIRWWNFWCVDKPKIK